GLTSLLTVVTGILMFTLTLRRGESPTDAQATHTPTGHMRACRACPAPADVTCIARRARRRLHSGSRAGHLVHGACVLVPTATASGRTPPYESGGRVPGALVPRGAPAGCNTPLALLLAQARTRLTPAVATPWRAAG